MKRFYYSNSFAEFFRQSTDEILGIMARNSDFDDVQEQKQSWIYQIECLRNVLEGFVGNLYFEYSIPRMGSRVDAILIIKHVVFVLEFKVGAIKFDEVSKEQVWDYGLDLKNFHKTSHEAIVAPILIATEATSGILLDEWKLDSDKLISPPICTNILNLRNAIEKVLQLEGQESIKPDEWADGQYSPTQQ